MVKQLKQQRKQGLQKINMSFKNCIIDEEYNKLESSLLDRNAELPENIVKIQYKYRSTYLFEIIRHEIIIDLIRLNTSNLEEQVFYIIPWGNEDVYEFRFDENIAIDYMNFMYEPEILKEIIPPKSAFGILHENIHIINKDKSIIIIADRYHDVLYFYSNNPIKNIDKYLVEYITLD